MNCEYASWLNKYKSDWNNSQVQSCTCSQNLLNNLQYQPFTKVIKKKSIGNVTNIWLVITLSYPQDCSSIFYKLQNEQ